jgi:hypothetical protein
MDLDSFVPQRYTSFPSSPLRDQLEADRPQVPGARRTICLQNQSGDLANLEALIQEPQMAFKQRPDSCFAGILSSGKFHAEKISLCAPDFQEFSP